MSTTPGSTSSTPFTDERLERCTLGALLGMYEAGGVLSRSLLDATGLVPEDFALGRHGLVFRALRTLVERERPGSVESVLAVTHGALSLLELATYERPGAVEPPGIAGLLLTHAEALRRLSALRRAHTFHLERLRALAEPGADPAEEAAALAAHAEGYVAAAQADETGDADVTELLEDWDAYERGVREPHLRTGIEVLDREVGGWVCNLNVVGGMPSVGKSALIGEAIWACLERGVRVGLFGLEDATKWLPRRHLARALHLPVSAIAACHLSAFQQELCQESAGRCHALGANLLVYRRAGIEPAALAQRCRHWVLNRGVKAIFVDHGGEVQHDMRGGRERYDLAVASTYRQLRDLAVNHRVPVVVLAHFNRETEKQGGVPTMQSFAETEYIARMARLALGLWQKPGDNRLRCTVLKRTEGARGTTVAIERDEACALVKRTGGEVLDLAEEKRRDGASAKAAAKGWRTEGAA